MRVAVKIGKSSVVVVFLAAILSCAGVEVKETVKSYRSLDYEIPDIIDIEKKDLEKMTVNVRIDRKSRYRIVVKPYRYTSGREKITMTGKGKFITQSGDGELSVMLLTVKDESIVKSEFFTVRGSERSILYSALEKELNRRLSN